jgi:hypothetical protein
MRHFCPVWGSLRGADTGLVFEACLEKNMAPRSIIKGSQARKESLEAFAVKLVDKIIQAANPEAIERYIGVAVKALGHEKVNGYIIQRFIDRVTRQLLNYEPTGQQEEENCSLAKSHLLRFRKALAAPAGP